MARFGLPNTIASDNGRQFSSQEFAALCSKNSITHLTSGPYCTQSNGAKENAVKSFKNGMTNALSDPKSKEESLDTLVNRYLFYYRSSVHATTLETPFKLMFGREMQTHFDRIKPPQLSAMCDQQITNDKSNRKVKEFAINDQVMVRDYRSKQRRWQQATITATMRKTESMCAQLRKDSGVGTQIKSFRRKW